MNVPKLPTKPKNESRSGVPLSTFFLLFSMVMLGILIGGFAVLLSAPTLYNYAATQAVFSTRSALLELQAQALAATAIELDSRASQNDALATAYALDSLSTRTELGNAGSLLGLTATQSQVNIWATTTAQANANVQQLTRIAQDYQATQAQLSANATQVDLNFQATRNALSGTPVVNAQSAALARPTDAPAKASPTVMRSAAIASLTPLPFENTTTPAPTQAALRGVFSEGISDAWLISGDADWAQSQEGIVAQSNNAWLLAREGVAGERFAQLIFTPALSADAPYDILLIGDAGDSLFVRLYTDSLQVVRVAVYRFDGGLPITGVGEWLGESQVNIPLAGDSQAVLVWEQDTFALTINRVNVLLMTLAMPSDIRIGIQMPKGAILSQITLD